MRHRLLHRTGAESPRRVDKAITLDPTHADAYFIKGTLFFAAAKCVQGSYVVPVGTTEALNKYLQLAPSGSHASDARQMLQFLLEKC